jgi:hypothetical protein
MVLACSRHLFLRPVLRMDQAAWTECHVAAFAFFGGCTARLVPENVPRNIFRLLFPDGLCAGPATAPKNCPVLAAFDERSNCHGGA